MTTLDAKSFPFPQRPVWRLGALALAASLAACAELPGDLSAPAPLRDAAALGLPAGAQPAVAADWWRAFGDEQLNALVAQALQGSPSLQLAQARLAKARAAVDVTGAADKPHVQAEVDLNRSLFSANYLYPPPLGGATYNTGTVQLEGSWELDLFGKQRAALNAAIGTARATEADAQAARVLLACQVARAYFQLVRLNDQLGVARRTLTQREEMLQIVRDRVNAGLDTHLELRQSEGGLPEARQQIEAIAEQMALARNALGALVGQPQAAQTLVPPPLDALKPLDGAAAIPADLLGRRADVVAARWRVEAAGQDVKNARALFYPNINLTAFAGYNAFDFSNVFKSDSKQWSVGPAITLPIFVGGQLRANLRVKAADLDAAVASYNATVLDAAHDAADQIASGQSIARQQVEQQAAQSAAESAYSIATQRYEAGLGTYLQVLSAETAVLAQRRQKVDLAARALDTSAALARALGGGYQPAGAAAPEVFGAIKSVATNPELAMDSGTFYTKTGSSPGTEAGAGDTVAAR